MNGLIDKFVTSHISSTMRFVEIIKDVELDDGQFFATLDIVNLYGSIPVEDHVFSGAISVVADFFEEYKDHSSLSYV